MLPGAPDLQHHATRSLLEHRWAKIPITNSTYDLLIHATGEGGQLPSRYSALPLIISRSGPSDEPGTSPLGFSDARNRPHVSQLDPKDAPLRRPGARGRSPLPSFRRVRISGTLGATSSKKCLQTHIHPQTPLNSYLPCQ